MAITVHEDSCRANWMAMDPTPRSADDEKRRLGSVPDLRYFQLLEKGFPGRECRQRQARRLFIRQAHGLVTGDTFIDEHIFRITPGPADVSRGDHLVADRKSADIAAGCHDRPAEIPPQDQRVLETPLDGIAILDVGGIDRNRVDTHEKIPPLSLRDRPVHANKAVGVVCREGLEDRKCLHLVHCCHP